MTESLSETTKVAVGKEVSSLDVSPQFDAYSGVELIVSGELTYLAGNRNGRVLTIQNPWGTQAQATAILNALQAKGFQYQPYTAEGAILNPAAEIGDGITISDTYSGLYKIDRKYSPLMSADVQAPQDEELDHEYPYEPKQDRIYKREISEANAQISLNADAITAEVNRASSAEGSLSSRITQTANAITTEVTNRTNADNNLNTTLTSKINQTASSINATVTQVSNNKLDHTRSNSSFGWDLTATAFKINANGSKNVFTANSSGIIIQGNATVTGKIQATSGFIGSSAANGFTITSSAIYNGKTSRTDANNGIYIGKDGIALGANSAFVVTNAGAVTAKNLTITGGSINVGNGAFKVTTTGAVTATNLALTGGSINLKNSSGTTVFSVSNGNVSAVNMSLSGTLTVGGSRITAANLYTGAAQAASGYSGWNSTKNTVSANSGTWSTGAGYGISYNKATKQGTSEYPTWFTAGTLHASNRVSAPEVSIESYPSQVNLSGHSHSISVSGGKVTFGSPTNGSQSFNIADTQYYKDGVESAYSDGYNDGYWIGGSTVTLSSLEYTWHTSTAAGYHIVLSNGREVYGSASF